MTPAPEALARALRDLLDVARADCPPAARRDDHRTAAAERLLDEMEPKP